MVDEAAIAGLYRRYGHALYRRSLLLLSNEDDAREILQETFLQFWRGRQRFEGRASPFTYLYRITTNLSIDRLRRRRTAGVQVDVDAAQPTSDRAERQTTALMQLAELTRGLDEETITIAVLSHVDGLTQEEIAAALDLSRRTIGKKLKKFFEYTRKRAAATGETLPQLAQVTEAHGR